MSTIQDTDILLVNRGGTDYKVNAGDLYEYFNPKMPWEKHLGWFHVKNATETIKLYVGYNYGFYPAWDIDGSNERMIDSFGPGDELIIAHDSNGCHRFFEKNYTGTWDFGPLTNTSRFSGFDFIFFRCKEFDGDVQYIDVGNAYNFGSLFNEAEKFTGKGIEKWRAPNLEYLSFTFGNCHEFVGDISNLLSGGSRLRSCTKTFQYATKFNCDISSWDVGGVGDFEAMFAGCEEFNQDLSTWDTHSAGRMYDMVRGAKSFNQDLTGWCVPNITSEPWGFKTDSGMPADGSKDPCWGHCPRGENGTVDPCPGPSFVIASVGTATANWSPYIKVEDYFTGELKDIYAIDSTDFYFDVHQRNPDNIFDGDDTNIGLYCCAPYTIFNPHVIFEPPGGISVQNSLTIVAGFHQLSQTGTLAVNDIDVLELNAWDLSPEPFTVPFTGSLDKFSIRQKLPALNDKKYAPGIASIYLDGKQLLNRTATTLTFTDDEFFDRIKVGTQLRQVSPEVTGVVSAIDSANLKVVLDDEYPEFVTGSRVIIVGEKV